VRGEMPEHTSHKYTVLVDDNFHFMDRRERYKLGEFDDCQGAVTACKEVVDRYLLEALKPGITAEQLWRSYASFGEDPFIIGPDEQCRFSAWDYARQRCSELGEG
jgi:hypothetical protein